MLDFDKKLIKKNFSKAALKYDKNAQIQLVAAQNLCLAIEKFLKPNSKILDLGSGTSFIAKNLLKKNPDLEITEVDFSAQMLNSWQDRPKNIKIIEADIENINFPNESFDFVLSSFSFQWLNDLPKLITKINNILKKDGILAFSLPLDETLNELKTSAKQCQIDLTINDFLVFTEITSILQNCGLKQHKFFQEKQIFSYTNLLDLLKSVKETGANYSKNNNFFNKNKFNKLSSFYLKNFNSENRIRATWNIGYFVAVK